MLDATSEPSWKNLISRLPADFEEIAVRLKAVNRQWANSQIKSAEDLLRLCFVHVGCDLPLRQTVALMAESGGPAVSHVVLHKRMGAAGPFLAELVARMTTLNEEAAVEKWAGYELCAVDATVATRPGSTGTDARIHAVIRLCDMRILSAHVTDATEGESFRRFTWGTGQLVLGDRGYSNARGIASVVAQGADVLVRVNRGAMPTYDASGAAIDVLAWARGLHGSRVSERRVSVRAAADSRARETVEGRMIAVRLPPEEIAEARRRVREEHGSATTKQQLEAAEYVVLFTTASAERLSAARCFDAYRLRWQVELMFKRWKSICHFDRLPNYRDDTIRSWLTAKVLLALLLDRIGSDTSELFPPAEWTPPPRRKPGRKPAATRASAMEAHQHPVASDHRRHSADDAA